MDQQAYGNALPGSMRNMFRNGEFKRKTTSGICQDYLQANVAIVHSDYASDFRRFVDSNRAPCPLLYQSEIGQVGAPVIADGSDIR